MGSAAKGKLASIPVRGRLITIPAKGRLATILVNGRLVTILAKGMLFTIPWQIKPFPYQPSSLAKVLRSAPLLGKRRRKRMGRGT